MVYGLFSLDNIKIQTNYNSAKVITTFFALLFLCFIRNAYNKEKEIYSLGKVKVMSFALS